MKRWDQARAASQRRPHKHSVLAPVVGLTTTGRNTAERRPKPPDGYRVTMIGGDWVWRCLAKGGYCSAESYEAAVAACWADFRARGRVEAASPEPLPPGWSHWRHHGRVDFKHTSGALVARRTSADLYIAWWNWFPASGSAKDARCTDPKPTMEEAMCAVLGLQVRQEEHDRKGWYVLQPNGLLVHPKLSRSAQEAARAALEHHG